jgi:hypothetical protein
MADAPFLLGAWLSGAFLDLCTGSAQQVERTLMAVLPRCLAGAVLAVTLLGRDFGGEDFTLRALSLADFFQQRGWRPARASLLSKSAVLYKSGGHQKVMTQFWVLP